MSSKLMRLLALLAAIVLVAAACGGDDDTSDATGDDATADGGDDGGGDDGGGGDDAGVDGGGDGGGEVASSPDDGVTDDTIKLGFMGDLTGPTAGTQVFFEAGIRAYVEFTNENGGVFGRELELISKDDEFSAETGAVNFAALAEDDKVLAVLGQGGSSIITALDADIANAGIPFIGPQQTIDSQFANPNIFSTLAHYGDQADIAVARMVSDVGGAGDLVVVSVGLEVASGLEWGAYIEQTVERAGGTYTEHISMPLTGANADAEVQTIQALVESEGVNYIALHGSPGAALRLLGSMESLGLDLPIGGIFAVIAENVYLEGPADLLDTYWGVQTYTPSNISTPGNDEMNAFVEANGGYSDQVGNVNFVGGWVVAKLAVEGILQAGADGTLTRADLIEAMNGISGFDTGGQSPALDCTREGRHCGAAGRPYDWNGTELVPSGDYGDFTGSLDFEYGLGG